MPIRSDLYIVCENKMSKQMQLVQQKELKRYTTK